MLEDFLSYIESNLSVFREDKILLSISGGVDSMVMLHLFRELEYNISVAHINHSTRKGASDQDMSFVKSICNEYSIPFFAKTLSYDQLSHGNFQENARKERFTFLQQLKFKHGFRWIATAHHKEDRWETFLMHLNRKSGIQGLTSLRAKEKQVIHPLLIYTKDEIINFAAQHKVKYVHDSSNDSNDYLRNSIRNKISPLIKQLFPNFISNINQSIQYLEKDNSLMKELIARSGFISTAESSGYVIIDITRIKSFDEANTLLFHIIEKYGFNSSDALDIMQSKSTGAIFRTSAYEGLLDRGMLIVRTIRDFKRTELTIHAPGKYILQNGRNLIVSIGDQKEIAQPLWLDIDKIKWPLTVRNIKPGDKIKPIGLKGATKSIKKLCTDLKISRFAKEDILVVSENEKIIQVIGIKTGNNYQANDIKKALTFKIVE